ncbi:MAG: efflux RND transporter periplasmic adaptor subunit [Acidobacteriota bacterium]
MSNLQKNRAWRRGTVLLFAVLVTFTAACGPRGQQVSGSGSATTESADPGLPPPLREKLESALHGYEQCRTWLAADRLEGLDREASHLAEILREARSQALLASPGNVGTLLEEAADAAASMAGAADLERARGAFAEVSRLLMALAVLDPSLVEGWHAFSCPMAAGFGKWIQPSSKLGNPYMGQAMLACGVPADWEVEEPAAGLEAGAHEPHVHAAGEIAYYTCSMHPSVKKQEPGTCPICSMDLTPVTRQEVETGVILVDARRRQLIGVRTAPVQARPVTVRVRAVGRVVYDERRLADVTLKYHGWIGTLHVDEPGQRVEKGETLFTLYSPELYAAQEEFLTALASQRAARVTNAPDRADYLVEAARKRLRLWDIRDWQIDRLAEAGRPIEHLPIVSPVTGYVVEKNVVEGAAVEPGSRLYRVAGLERVWIEAEVYESDLPLIEAGQQARVDLPYLPGRSFQGRVSFVYPYLEPGSRTGRVRVEVENPALRLKPDMYANVTLEVNRGRRLVVPVEAVLYAGPRRLVFVDLGEGRLRPQEIEVGVRSGDDYEVLSGLEAGDVVVTSGNFLVAAESRLKSATEMW